MLNHKTTFATLLALLLLAGCGSTSDIFGGGGSNYPNGGGNGYPNGTYANDIRGTVDSVDANTHSIWLVNTNGMASSGGNGSVRVYYDNRTTVSYNGRSFRPEDLERGDQIDARVTQSGNRIYTDAVTVTYNASANGTNPYPSNGSRNPYPGDNGTYGGSQSYATIRGTVRSVDTYNHTIQLDQTNWVSGFNRGANTGSTLVVQYDPNVSVDVQGQLYPVTNLERGDVIEVQADNLGNGLFARRITLVRDVRR
jgi:hypothetical protein